MPPSVRRRKSWPAWLSLAFVLPGSISAASADVLPVCAGPNRAGRVATCVYDGDTGWQDGTRWRLKGIDAPEIGSRKAECRAEQLKAIRARDRLRLMLARGFTVVATGREDRAGRSLVNITLTDGRDVALQMMSEGIVQAWPNTGNVWCGR